VKSATLNGFPAITKVHRVKAAGRLAANAPGARSMDFKKWKSGQHVKPGRWPDPELLHSVNQAKRFRQVCPYCMEHKRTCPVCADVI